MLGEELVHHVLTKIGRAQNAAIGKWPLNKQRQPDEMIERTTEFLQIQFDVREDSAPLRCRIANGTAALFERVIVIGSRRVARKKNEPLCAGHDSASSPRHQSAAFQFLMCHQFQMSLRRSK